MAKWTRKYMDSLPDSAFLIVLPGGEKEDGVTEPKSKRKFPVRDNEGNIDKDHLDDALARIPDSKIPDRYKEQAQSKAEKLLTEWKKKHGKIKKSMAGMSYNELRSELQAVVQQKYGKKSKDGNYWMDYPYVCDVYEKEVVAEKEGKFYIADYAVDDNGNVQVGPFYDAKKTYSAKGKTPVKQMGKAKPSNSDVISAR